MSGFICSSILSAVTFSSPLASTAMEKKSPRFASTIQIASSLSLHFWTRILKLRNCCENCSFQGVDDDNGDLLVLKNSIKSAIAKQQYETFSKLTNAAKVGDVETIRELIRSRADLDAVDYDGRSALAMVLLIRSSFVVI